MKIGDKIKIKFTDEQLKKKKLEEEETFNDIVAILKSKMAQVEKIKWCETCFEILELWFTKDELNSCINCKKKLIPVLFNLVEKGSIEFMPKFFDFYKRAYQFSARRDFECFVEYMEWEQPKKVYSVRKSVLKPFVDGLQRLTFDPKLKYMVVSYPPSLGKCIEENTPVWTPKGNIPIKYLNIGDEVYSMKDKEVCIETVTQKWETRKKQVEITLFSGRKITISPEHRMLTFDGYKKAEELKVGDYFYSLYANQDINKRIDEDELFFITSMIFEGYCKKNGMNFTGEDNEMTREFLAVCERLGITYKKDTKDGNKASSYRLLQGDNGKNVELLKKYGIYNHLCYTKRLPQSFFTMPLEQKYKFIGIMFATDGYICKDNGGIALANEGLIDDIQFLLSTCKIYSKKTRKYDKQFNKEAWVLTIPKDLLISLKDKIYLFHKQNKLLSLEEKRKTDRTEKKFEMFLKYYPELEEHKYKDFYWEKIVDIKYIDEEINMVDIEVSNTHNFIANGYVSHNSYISSLYTAWGMGISINNSVLRLSYSDELVLGFSRTVKGYLCSPEFSDVFTNFKLYGGKPFEVERESDWKIKNAKVPKSNHIARTRSGSTTGERASFAIIFDDMTKGAEEANSESTHRGIYDKWLTEWWNRRDGQNCNFIFVGTQWCPEDILNRIIVDRDKVSPLKPTDNPYVMESEDTIVIRVPMLDENDKTTCPEVYPQEVAEEIRDNTDPFLYSCVYQQSPIAPTGREFAYECIRTYEELPENLTDNSFATLDTARKGKDNVSMPIFRNDSNGSWYLVDAMFKQKAMDDLYDEIVDKIINNMITLLVIENNIDTSLKFILNNKLTERQCFFCEIVEKYNTVKKEERIKNNRGIVQKQMVFPEKKLFKPNTDIGRLMDNFTKYSFDKPALHDDGPDSICMMASEIILKNGKVNKPKAVSRPF